MNSTGVVYVQINLYFNDLLIIKQTSLSQNEGLSSEAILRLQPWDTVVVPFKGKRCEMLVVCVDKEGKKVTVANPIRRKRSVNYRLLLFI